MYIDKMIKMFMTFISYLIDKGWNFRIIDKYVNGKLILDENGFCVIINDQKTYVSPEYVIDLLIKSYYTDQKEFIYISRESLFDVSYRVSVDTVNNSPSWTRIMYFIKRIQNNNLKEQGNKVIDFDYYQLHSYLSSLNPKYFTQIINEIMNLSYEEIINLEDNPCLSKQIESLYWVEELMSTYIYEEIKDEISAGIIERANQELDIEDYQSDIEVFLKIIKIKNDSRVVENDIEWLKYKYNNIEPKNESILMKKKEILPSSLEVTVAYQRMN